MVTGNLKAWQEAALTPRIDDQPETYSFTYEAKSTTRKSGRVPSDDVNAGKLQRHRLKHRGDYTLVVAPDFAEGVVVEECERYKVTLMRATDLATLLIRSGEPRNDSSVDSTNHV